MEECIATYSYIRWVRLAGGDTRIYPSSHGGTILSFGSSLSVCLHEKLFKSAHNYCPVLILLIFHRIVNADYIVSQK